jgi:hypothetical protein
MTLSCVACRQVSTLVEAGDEAVLLSQRQEEQHSKEREKRLERQAKQLARKLQSPMKGRCEAP